MTKRTRLGACAALAAAAALVAGAPAGASAMQVSGTQTLVKGGDTPTDATDDVFRMSGGLIGSWFTVTADFQGSDPISGRAVLTGKERFEGCLDANRDGRCSKPDPTGKLEFGYVFWGEFDANFKQISGQCVHPTIVGTDGFAGTTGVLRFVDRPGTGTSIYRGRLQIARRAGAKARTGAAVHAVAARPVAMRTCA
jgi:hypothetical protein